MSSLHQVSVVVPVYRDGLRAIAAVNGLLEQALPTGVNIEIIVVDDGSGDDTAQMLSALRHDSLTVLSLPRNGGRSAARNAGAARASGEKVLFMDCDCIPANQDLISAHLRAWKTGTVASLGAVVGRDDGFWSRYQRGASARRARAHANGICYSGSSQNLMVSRALFLENGGFDEAYRTYGFEDRDLQIRLSGDGNIVWASDAIVQHMDDLDLATVSRKMVEAGGPAAVLFSDRHPVPYKALGYAALDVRLRPWLGPVARIFRRRIDRISNAADRTLENRLVPYWIKSAIVRLVTALSYMVGSAMVGYPESTGARRSR